MITALILAGMINMGVSADPPQRAIEHMSALSVSSSDTSGWMPSLYHGLYYQKGQGQYRRCVMTRESHINYLAANKHSSARGAYQFLDNNWRKPMVWMMLKESKITNDSLSETILTLVNKPMNKWSRYFQDRAFFTALNIRGRYVGSNHWNADGPGCSVG